MDLTELFPVGTTNEAEFLVDEENIASHVGSGEYRVLATPSMIAFMERVSHSLLAKSLPAGYSSVGVLVEVRHLAPTPAGGTVKVCCEVVEVDWPKITFAVSAWDKFEKVGEGRHQRVVIEEARFLRRVEAKSKS